MINHSYDFDINSTPLRSITYVPIALHRTINKRREGPWNKATTNSKWRPIDVFRKWRLWHGNEARMLFSRSILVFNYQTDMFFCFIFAKIAK